MDTGKKIGTDAQKGYLIVESGTDRPFRILYADRAACDLTGLSAENLLSVPAPKPVPASLEATSMKRPGCRTACARYRPPPPTS